MRCDFAHILVVRFHAIPMWLQLCIHKMAQCAERKWHTSLAIATNTAERSDETHCHYRPRHRRGLRREFGALRRLKSKPMTGSFSPPIAWAFLDQTKAA